MHRSRGRYRDEGVDHLAIASAGLSSAQLLRPFVGREPVAAQIDPPRCELVLKHPEALRCMSRNATTDLSISEAYIRDNLEVGGVLKPDQGQSSR